MKKRLHLIKSILNQGRKKNALKKEINHIYYFNFKKLSVEVIASNTSFAH
jgi:hypothetical protein